jgi:hypothetical protein
MSTDTIINAIQSGNNIEAGVAFKEVIHQKLTDAIAAKKIEVAASIVAKPSKTEEE